ncbi:hypothetical protein DPMN_030402 [Dreissena polymorpha]|uniref:Uncharacterized protein n=1 Tax=Dreissena polymorpha TaxID=45954 RepID=A0A9D4M0B5_DREPO|nr:hypothetical protein DPMN_030402 [Dreissena polymorpha]
MSKSFVFPLSYYFKNKHVRIVTNLKAQSHYDAGGAPVRDPGSTGMNRGSTGMNRAPPETTGMNRGRSGTTGAQPGKY